MTECRRCRSARLIHLQSLKQSWDALDAEGRRDVAQAAALCDPNLVGLFECLGPAIALAIDEEEHSCSGTSPESSAA